ncbi:multiple cyclophane-containing RiPP AmcA [Micromonospora yangpuensis]|uniref:multiple cyclophane-containing RiPP AmcA n=1 Tax=Micromonospora yangpuensis TaxID=683228 RepID=UPI0035A25A28
MSSNARPTPPGRPAPLPPTPVTAADPPLFTHAWRRFFAQQSRDIPQQQQTNQNPETVVAYRQPRSTLSQAGNHRNSSDSDRAGNWNKKK